MKKCGDCYYWMKKRFCPREGFALPPTMGERACSKFITKEEAFMNSLRQENLTLKNNNTELLAEIESLKAELAKERAVVDFYADPKNSGFENKDFDEGDDAEIMYYNVEVNPINGSEDAVLAQKGFHTYEDYMWGKLARQRQRERNEKF